MLACEWVIPVTLVDGYWMISNYVRRSGAILDINKVFEGESEPKVMPPRTQLRWTRSFTMTGRQIANYYSWSAHVIPNTPLATSFEHGERLAFEQPTSGNKHNISGLCWVTLAARKYVLLLNTNHALKMCMMRWCMKDKASILGETCFVAHIARRYPMSSINLAPVSVGHNCNSRSYYEGPRAYLCVDSSR